MEQTKNRHCENTSTKIEQKCFKCGKTGHYALECEEKIYASQKPLVRRIDQSGHINRLSATKMHLDTGSSMTLIHRNFSPQCDSSGQFVQMINTTGTQTYPVIKAKIELDRHSYEIDVAVSEHLLEEMLLRIDLPLMKHLIYAMNSEEKQTAREQLGHSETFYAVTTRAQAQ